MTPARPGNRCGCHDYHREHRRTTATLRQLEAALLGRGGRAAAPVVGLAVLVALTGCTRNDGPIEDGRLRVVASTSTYGDIAEASLGPEVDVVSIIDDASVDPRLYEPTESDAAAVAEADIILLNGGGYDDFLLSLARDHNPSALVIDAFGTSGFDPAAEHDDHVGWDDEFEKELEPDLSHVVANPLVWYHFGTISALADRLLETVAQFDDGWRDAVQGHTREFQSDLVEIQARADRLATRVSGSSLTTDGTSAYLLRAIGLSDRTPESFLTGSATVGIEELDVSETVTLLQDESIVVLAMTERTSMRRETLLESASSGGVEVMELRESMPAGLTYIEWMSSNLDALEAVVGG